MKERAKRDKQIVHKGQQAWLYTDGSIRNDSGHFLAPHPDGAEPITSENAREMRKLRAIKHAEAAMKGVMRAARTSGNLDYIPGSLEAWEMLSEQIALIPYKDGAKDRDKIEALRALALVTDVLPARIPDDPVTGQAVDADITRLILERVRVRMQRQGSQDAEGQQEAADYKVSQDTLDAEFS